MLLDLAVIEAKACLLGNARRICAYMVGDPALRRSDSKDIRQYSGFKIPLRSLLPLTWERNFSGESFQGGHQP